VRLKAAQAAHLADGVLVEARRASPGQLVDVPALGLSRHLSRRLRGVVTPEWGCTLALAAAAGLQPQQLAALNMADLAADGRELAVGDRRFDIPDHAAGLVRSQLLTRRQEGAE